MTLTTYDDLEQRSEEWFAARRGIVTASAIGQLITAKTIRPAANDYSRALTAELVAERITGFTDATYMSADMWRGVEDEPRAIEVYAAHYAPVVEVGFMVRQFDGFKIGFSPDGLVGDDGLVEVKSRKPKKQLADVIAGEVPAENMAQLQAGLLVSGRDWCDYISFSAGMHLWRTRVTPDERWFTAIESAARTFEENAAEMTDKYLKAVEGFPMTERVVELEMTF